MVLEQRYDVVVIEMVLPDVDGTAAWSHVHRVSPTTVGVMTTSYTSLYNPINALEPGILAFLQKPLIIPTLCNFIARALEPQGVPRERRSMESRLAGLSRLLSSVRHAASAEVVFQKTLAHLRAVLTFDWVAMYRLNEDGLSWRRLVEQPRLSDGEALSEAQLEFIQQRVIEVVHSLQPQVWSPSVTSSVHGRVSALQKLGLRNLVLVPVIDMDQPYGVLVAINRLDSDRRFAPSEVQALSVVSHALRLALHRVRLEQEPGAEAMHDRATGTYTPMYLARLIGMEAALWKRCARPFSLMLIYLGNLSRSDVVARLPDWQVAILLPETAQAGANQALARVTKGVEGRLAEQSGMPIRPIKAQVVIPTEEVQSLGHLLTLAYA